MSCDLVNFSSKIQNMVLQTQVEQKEWIDSDRFLMYHFQNNINFNFPRYNNDYQEGLESQSGA